ncbi:hypothetical protein BX285_1251 [Streptomyces sp. 1114.5]|uniref:hypothetical protein n=1 Tax=Streptomyces sp. 1114.5 TaxID=1938830 RepID=UPI000EB18D5F|nr:hypothetical protein [Streptomyces sp. 1114.5]RKT16895.1 hypothetical protein BX285_1251 [Streptomyces sp. 1114.5]
MTTITDSRGIAGAQINAAGALMSLLTAHATLPTPAIQLEHLKVPGTHDYAWGLDVALHRGLDHFEQWRQALGIDPAAVDYEVTTSGTLGWLTVTTVHGGVPLKLIGYLTPLPAPEHNDSSKEVTR